MASTLAPASQPRPLLLVALSLLIAGLATGAAHALLNLISLITHLAFFGKIETGHPFPAQHELGPG